MTSKIGKAKDKQLAGSVEEALGKLTGIDELERRGARKKDLGKAEEALVRKQAAAAKKVAKPDAD